MTTDSYFKCPKCRGTLVLTEYYLARDLTEFLPLDHVTVECKKCKFLGKGIDELEAYQDLLRKAQNSNM